MKHTRKLATAVLSLALGATRVAYADPDVDDATTVTAGAADADSDEATSLMGALSHRGLHDRQDETWNAYTQETTITSSKRGFAAAYTDLHGATKSLSPNAEGSFTQTITLFAGMRPWRGAEFYVVPELAGGIPLSNLGGLGSAIQNGELQKSGAVVPAPYLSRVFLRQTIGFGGEAVHKDSGMMQLGTNVTSRRLVFTVGNFAALDLFDHNAYAGDVRRQFLNMAFMTYTAYDMAADARGYTWGGAAELFWDDWAVRFARLAAPSQPNQLPLDFDLLHTYGDQAEIEHKHAIAGLPGEVRVMGFRNRELMGYFSDAIASFQADPSHTAANCMGFTYGSMSTSAPDLCWARRSNTKVGIGVNAEQSLGHGVGVFLRAMVNDGKGEVISYLSADSGIAGGALATGEVWHRPHDLAGVAFSSAYISDSHAKYLAMGGIDGFVGDGALTYAPERALEAFYSYSVASWLSVTADFQEIWNPGFNSDRAPVTILGGRLHAEL